MRLRALAPGKVNLCLFLGPVRAADGKHELVTVFESLSLADELTLSTEGASDQVACPGVQGPNLVSGALQALRAAGWGGPPVRIEIDKRVPIAGGMGGGSADAAAALRLARELAPIEDRVLQSVAVGLGADVSSQLAPGPSIGTGAGDLVEPLASLPAHAFVILPHDLPLPTAAVYEEADRLGLCRDAAGLAAALDEVRSALGAGGPPPPVNDLGRAALSLCPQIERALAAAREFGAEQAIVCGSGPTVAGLYWGADAGDRAAVAVQALTPRFPRATAAAPVAAEFGIPRFA